jgi:hypothetical protein
MVGLTLQRTTGEIMTAPAAAYPIRLAIDYPDRLDRTTTAFRLLWVIPIAILLVVLGGSSETTVTTFNGAGDAISRVTSSGGGIGAALFVATGLMILFRQRYPRWWFDFARELSRFVTRVGTYLALLTDRYPSTVEEQSVHLDIDYPDVPRDLNRWLPLVKWLLVIPHYVALTVLWLVAIPTVFIAWFAILITGRYPRALFNYIVGVSRWSLRVHGYAFLLVTDQYPPFSLR